MSQATFDTYEYVKQPRKVGVPEEQAEIHARTLAELINQKLVTREYLDLRLQQMEWQIDRRFERMDHRIKQMRNQLTVRLGD